MYKFNLLKNMSIYKFSLLKSNLAKFKFVIICSLLNKKTIHFQKMKSFTIKNSQKEHKQYKLQDLQENIFKIKEAINSSLRLKNLSSAFIDQKNSNLNQQLSSDTYIIKTIEQHIEWGKGNRKTQSEQDMTVHLKNTFQQKVEQLNKKMKRKNRNQYKKYRSLQRIENQNQQSCQRSVNEKNKHETVQQNEQQIIQGSQQDIKTQNSIFQNPHCRNQSDKEIRSDTNINLSRLSYEKVQKIYNQCKQQERQLSNKLQLLNQSYQARQKQISTKFKQIIQQINQMHCQMMHDLEQQKQNLIESSNIQQQIYGFIIMLKKIKKIHLNLTKQKKNKNQSTIKSLKQLNCNKSQRQLNCNQSQIQLNFNKSSRRQGISSRYLINSLSNANNGMKASQPTQLLKKLKEKQKTIDFIDQKQKNKVQNLSQTGKEIIEITNFVQQRLQQQYKKYSAIIQKVSLFFKNIHHNQVQLHSFQQKPIKNKIKSQIQLDYENIDSGESILFLKNSKSFIKQPLMLDKQKSHLEDWARRLVNSTQFRSSDLKQIIQKIKKQPLIQSNLISSCANGQIQKTEDQNAQVIKNVKKQASNGNQFNHKKDQIQSKNQKLQVEQINKISENNQLRQQNQIQHQPPIMQPKQSQKVNQTIDDHKNELIQKVHQDFAPLLNEIIQQQNFNKIKQKSFNEQNQSQKQRKHNGKEINQLPRQKENHEQKKIQIQQEKLKAKQQQTSIFKHGNTKQSMLLEGYGDLEEEKYYQTDQNIEQLQQLQPISEKNNKQVILEEPLSNEKISNSQQELKTLNSHEQNQILSKSQYFDEFDSEIVKPNIANYQINKKQNQAEKNNQIDFNKSKKPTLIEKEINKQAFTIRRDQQYNLQTKKQRKTLKLALENKKYTLHNQTNILQEIKVTQKSEKNININNQNQINLNYQEKFNSQYNLKNITNRKLKKEGINEEVNESKSLRKIKEMGKQQLFLEKTDKKRYINPKYKQLTFLQSCKSLDQLNSVYKSKDNDMSLRYISNHSPINQHRVQSFRQDITKRFLSNKYFLNSIHSNSNLKQLSIIPCSQNKQGALKQENNKLSSSRVSQTKQQQCYDTLRKQKIKFQTIKNNRIGIIGLVQNKNSRIKGWKNST